jgi:hypothetical protein
MYEGLDALSIKKMQKVFRPPFPCSKVEERSDQRYYFE